MKKFLFFAAFFLLISSAFAQSASTNDVKRFSVTQETKVPFRLYPTANAWNFLKLDTRTGQIWAVQFSTSSVSKTFEWKVADTPIESDKAENIGRFTLYPTTNNYTFILLDQFDGRCWQVQFDLDNSYNNLRIRIY